MVLPVFLDTLTVQLYLANTYDFINLLTNNDLDEKCFLYCEFIFGFKVQDSPIINKPIIAPNINEKIQ